MFLTRNVHVVAIGQMLGLSLLVACGQGEVANTADGPRPGTDAAVEAKVQADPVPAFMKAFSERSPALIGQRTVAGAVSGALGTLLADTPKRRRKDPIENRQVLVALYAPGVEGSSAIHLARPDGVTEAGSAVLATLAESAKHGLDPERYGVAKIEKRVAELKAKAAGSPKAPALSASDLDALEKAIRASKIDVADVDHASAKVLDLAIGDDSPVPRFKQAFDAYVARQKGDARAVAALELALADGLSTYATDMRYGNRWWWPAEDFEDADEGEVLRAKLVGALGAAMGSADKLTAFLDALPPHHDQYAKLVAGLAEYRKIRDAGGWKTVKKASLKRGAKGKRVRELKERLAAEHFFPPRGSEATGELSDVFDSDLTKSLKWYQGTHQLKVTGESSAMFWKSLNVPVQERIDRVKVTLSRWRESEIGNDTYYVLVNIPDFHAELWRDGERLMRFKIVAGNTKWGCDRKTKRWMRVNATPLQSNAIRNIILNPYWNIPERIWREELIPKKNENPNLYEEKGYECVPAGDNECARLRQRSGPGNALGRVKFIFPNSHNTYMHDTPKKNFFNFPIRAFSHGCMRVQNPLDLAETLLKNDGSYDDKAFKRTLASDVEQNTRLKTPVPIHIEYYTVRVDDDGRLNFLADIYKYDRDRLKGVERKYKKCEPEPFVEEEEVDDGALDDGLTTDGLTPEGGAEASPTGVPSGDKPAAGALPPKIVKTEGGAALRAIGRKPVTPPVDKPSSKPATP